MTFSIRNPLTSVAPHTKRNVRKETSPKKHKQSFHLHNCLCFSIYSVFFFYFFFFVVKRRVVGADGVSPARNVRVRFARGHGPNIDQVHVLLHRCWWRCFEVARGNQTTWNCHTFGSQVNHKSQNGSHMLVDRKRNRIYPPVRFRVQGTISCGKRHLVLTPGTH